MRPRRFAAWLYLFTLLTAPAAILVFDSPPAMAQIQREPTSQLGKKLTSKLDEVCAIAVKVGAGLMVFYGVFIVVKFLAGNGREAWPHLLYFALGGALLAAIDSVVSWSQS